MMQTIFMHQQCRPEAADSSSPSDESVRLEAGFALTPKAFASGRWSRGAEISYPSARLIAVVRNTGFVGGLSC
jgi:hypothetical protein